MAQDTELLELIELGFEENDEFGSGITAMSVVRSPAIKSNFIKLAEQKPMQFAEADAEKRLLVGPALIPDLPIYRRDEDTKKEYYAFFKADTIEKLAYSFLKHGRQNNSTVEHEFAVDGMGIVESWIVQDPEKDKAAALGIEVPKGTWMIAMKVRNQRLWDEWLKTGKLTGFSIEAMLTNKPKVEQSEQARELTEAEVNRINQAVLHLLNVYSARHGKA